MQEQVNTSPDVVFCNGKHKNYVMLDYRKIGFLGFSTSERKIEFSFDIFVSLWK
jgi:hypothetical protein